MLVYQCPGPHHGPSGSTYAFKGVEGDNAPAGWHASLVEAVEAFKAPRAPTSIANAINLVVLGAVEKMGKEAYGDADDDATLTRAELEAEAKRLGVKLDSRNTDERLAERIVEAMDAKAAKAVVATDPDET